MFMSITLLFNMSPFFTDDFLLIIMVIDKCQGPAIILICVIYENIIMITYDIMYSIYHYDNIPYNVYHLDLCA